MKSFSYTELDLLAGEVLPERAVLSTLLVGGGNDNDNTNLNVGGHGHGHGQIVTQNACQSSIGHPQGGLLGVLGLSNQQDVSTFVCEPGQTAVNG
ncbi:hypothetical protein [Actinomadura roseirufa]|uniref:hypothetical protein n=1 Tax=Actinomadura roseirufa TaxID=2094049 RepID=UPI001040E3AA|nr:hypothetical protein [Actinomadura roseirufa]